MQARAIAAAAKKKLSSVPRFEEKKRMDFS